MGEAAYVAVDWGTSSFRLWLVDQAGDVLGERRSDEGMMAAGKLGFPAVLQSHLEAVGAPPGLPVVICGMAGARQGWVEAGYVDTPARLASILEHAVPAPGQDRDIRILPGIARVLSTVIAGINPADKSGEALARLAYDPAFATITGKYFPST